MTDEHHSLGNDLLQRALDGTDHPAHAVSVLMSAAGTILQRSFGDAAAIDLMTQALDQTGALIRRERAH